jgi:hypothetical protein
MVTGSVVLGGAAAAVNSPQPTVASADPIDASPNILEGRVLDITQVGNRIYVGGTFTQVKDTDGTTLSRPYLFAMDATSFAVDRTFVPALNGSVLGLAPASDGTGVFVAGSFRTVNGIASRGLAKLDPATGVRIATFSAPANADVNDVVVRGSTVYIGGAFTSVKKASRLKLAAVDATTGDVRASLNVPVAGERYADRVGPSVFRLDATPDGSKLVLIGNFRTVGGLAREQVAVIDTAADPAVVSAWATASYEPMCASVFDSYTKGLDISPDGTWMVIATTGAFGGQSKLCDSVARWDLTATSDGQVPVWVEYTGGDTLLSAAITDTAVYVGGHQRWHNNGHTSGEYAGPGAVRRSGVAALDPTTGVPLSWNPGRTPGRGLEAIFSNSTHVFFGSDTEQFGGESGKRLAILPVAGGAANPAPQTVALPVAGIAGRADGTATGFTFDGQSFGTGTAPTFGWATVSGAFVQNGQLVTLGVDDVMRTRTYSDTLRPANTNLTSKAKYLGDPPRNSDGTGTNGSSFYATADALAYRGGKIFYTRINDTKLFWRKVSLESGIVGSQEFVADASRDWSTTTGLEIAGRWLYASDTTGTLTRTYLGADDRLVASSRTVVDAGGAMSWADVTDLVFVPVAGVGYEPAPPTAGGAVVCPAGQYRAEYFANKGLSGTPDTVRCETRIDYSWGIGAPSGTTLAPDNYSVRWTGTFDFAGGITTFTTTTDDGARLWVDGTLLIDRWIDQGSTAVSSTTNLTGGDHTVVMEYYENAGDASARLGVTSTPAPPEPTITCAPGQLIATYWANRALSGAAALERCENGPGFAYSWGSGSPGTGVPVDNFSGRWRSTLDVDVSRHVTFTVRTDDGVRLYVDGALLINQWTDRGPTTNTVTLVLEAGAHAVEMQYYEKGSGAVAEYSATLGTVVVPPKTVLLVVNDPVALRSAEAATAARLQARNLAVTYVDDALVDAAAADGFDLVWVASTVTASSIGDRLDATTAPVVVSDTNSFVRLDLSLGSGNQGTTPATTVTVVADGDPLAAGRTGTVSVLGAAGELGFGTPNVAPGGATVVAEVVAGRAGIFRYGPGSTLATGATAAGCRIGVPFEGSTVANLTVDGAALFDAAIDDALSVTC